MFWGNYKKGCASDFAPVQTVKTGDCDTLAQTTKKYMLEKISNIYSIWFKLTSYQLVIKIEIAGAEIFNVRFGPGILIT